MAARVPIEPAREFVAIECRRLDALIEALWSKAVDGDEGAVATMLRVMERRARMLGLDAPTKHELTQVHEFGDHLLAVAERELDRDSYLKLVRALADEKPALPPMPAEYIEPLKEH